MRRIAVVFILTTLVMLFIFNSADWYARNSALPRYCEDPQQNIEIVREILTSATPGEGKKRRPYIVAAKLIFLVPQTEAETLDAYLVRLRQRISQSCGVAF
ncbi:MAG: hypothetical protein GXP03_00420 [Alphaproteobacteria bacterium]|nr:hypothetical protein [Alphaproteobacteria bacterium]